MRIFRIIFLALLLCAISYFAFVVYVGLCDQRAGKEQIIELSKIEYGLFNIDSWKHIVANILTRKIEEFDMDAADKELMRGKIEEFLYGGIAKLENTFRKERDGSVGGFMKSLVASVTDVFGAMKKSVPDITNDVLNFMEKEENRAKMNKFILGKLDTYLDKTFSETDYTKHDAIIAEYGCEFREETIFIIQNEIASKYNVLRIYFFLLAGALILFFLALLFFKDMSPVEIILASLITSTFLLSGILLPMIEIDARIERFNFHFLGEQVIFSEQVLYFKSKSILEVVRLLLEQHKIEVIIVGVLVLAFSVILPVTKLLSTILYSLFTGVRRNVILNFFIFKTGKWSMADVMVVAILMAYIGFDSILTEQLHQLEAITSQVQILTTNHSSLQPGFFFFTAFVVFSLLIAHRMHQRIEKGIDPGVSPQPAIIH